MLRVYLLFERLPFFIFEAQATDAFPRKESTSTHMPLVCGESGNRHTPATAHGSGALLTNPLVINVPYFKVNGHSFTETILIEM
jgi:hypothetical protein